MEKKNNNIIVVILSVVVLVLFFLFGGYVLVDQGVIKLNFGKGQIEEKNEKEELDINSRLVQNLYDSVTVDGVLSSVSYWVYSDSLPGPGSYDFKNFYAESASEQIKMNIVGMNLLESKQKFANCSSVNIPKENSFGISACYANTMPGYEGLYISKSYDRSYIERVYKNIFGKDEKLDTSIDIPMNFFGSRSYSYVASEDAYVLYVAEVGGTGGPGGYSASLKSAAKDGNMLYIYEDVKNEIYDSNSVYIKTEKYTMTYTFELEDDNMYKFVSAVMKAK